MDTGCKGAPVVDTSALVLSTVYIEIEFHGAILVCQAAF